MCVLCVSVDTLVFACACVRAHVRVCVCVCARADLARFNSGQISPNLIGVNSDQGFLIGDRGGN